MLKIIKIGGRIIENASTLEKLALAMAAMAPKCILVHGGGSLATTLSHRLGIESQMIDGRRITDSATLDITVMAYAGLANKNVVARLLAHGVKACGISGCDMATIVAHKRVDQRIDWGFVGDIDRVDTGSIGMLLKGGIVPVISPITCSADGQLLNSNADSVAAAVASAMALEGEVELTFCLDLPGVLADVNDPQSVIERIDASTYADLKAEGKIFSGMIPKLDNAFKTLASGVSAVRITDIDHLDSGTLIVKS